MAKETWIVAGLGNPGENYRHTRHNVGFRVVEALAVKHHARLKEKGKAILGSITLFDKEVVLFFPQTFMNASGEALGPYAHYHQIPSERVLVVSDDLDLPVGNIRFKPSGGSGGHHGLDSVIVHLGSKNFPRIRIGVGKPPSADEGPDHVLSGFKLEEKPLIDAAIDRARDGVELFLEKGAPATMNVINQDVHRKNPSKKTIGIEELISKFKDYGVQKSSSFYLRYEKAPDFIEACYRNEIFILGIEGFLIDSSQTLPVMDLILDMSSLANLSRKEKIEKSYLGAKTFISKVAPMEKLHFNFCLDEPK